MPTLTQSQTIPINPSSSTPQLTLSEIWEVLLLKCRKPQLFVAAFSSCTVLDETPTSMKRRAVFKEGMGPPGGEVVEDLEIRGPWKVCLHRNTYLYSSLLVVWVGERYMGWHYGGVKNKTNISLPGRLLQPHHRRLRQQHHFARQR